MRSRPSICAAAPRGACADHLVGPGHVCSALQPARPYMGNGSPHLSGSAVYQGIARRLGHRGVLQEKGLDFGKNRTRVRPRNWLGIAVVDFELLKEQLPKARLVNQARLSRAAADQSEWEIDCMRKACEIGAMAWRRAFEDLRPGIAALDCSENVLRYYLEGGADLNSEPPMVSARPVQIALSRNGDVLYIDGGCNYSATKWISLAGPSRVAFAAPAVRARWDVGHSQRNHRTHETWRSVRELFEFSQRRLGPASRVAKLFGPSLQADRSRHRPGKRTAVDSAPMRQ